jgi:hypothetical protein
MLFQGILVLNSICFVAAAGSQAPFFDAKPSYAFKWAIKKVAIIGAGPGYVQILDLPWACRPEYYPSIVVWLAIGSLQRLGLTSRFLSGILYLAETGIIPMKHLQMPLFPMPIYRSLTLYLPCHHQAFNSHTRRLTMEKIRTPSGGFIVGRNQFGLP